MPRQFTNMDSLYLVHLADSVFSPDQCAPMAHPKTFARLMAIAENLQRMDEANQILSNNRTYEQGVADAEARMRRRSNLIENPEGEDERGAQILKAINRYDSVPVKRIPQGVRALEDKPHMFNGPVRKQPAKPKPAVDLKLDIDDILDF